MGDYFTKHHPPHHHKEIQSTYLYMSNATLKLKPTVVQGCVDVTRMYVPSKLTTVMCTGDQMKGMEHGRLTIRLGVLTI